MRKAPGKGLSFGLFFKSLASALKATFRSHANADFIRLKNFIC